MLRRVSEISLFHCKDKKNQSCSLGVAKSIDVNVEFFEKALYYVNCTSFVT
jgi:hypothetical protein